MYMKYCWKLIPLIGGLTNTKLQDHWVTAGQLVFMIFFALLPSLLFGFYDYVLNGEIHKAIEAIKQTISHGELFMISASLLGPISYLALFDNKTIDPFPNRTSIIFTTIAILIFSSVAYIAVNKLNGDSISDISINISVIFLGLAIFMVYLITVYQNSRLPDINEMSLRQQEADKTEQIIQHWQGQNSSNTTINFKEDEDYE